jgi:predicted nucleic acid-binding protein
LVADFPGSFVTDAEVLQELLHRYLAIRAWSVGESVFDRFAILMKGRIAPMPDRDVELAGSLVNEMPRLQARDLIHLAVMRRLGATRIVSSDRGFDAVPGVERLDPARFDEWRDTVVPGSS